MSYVRTYTVTVPYSGSVHYPASKSGGWKPYAGTETVVVNIHVDTDPFDMSVSNANTIINALTGSVAAMNTANCFSIKQSADKVSQSLVNGFYSLMSSDITTKRSECYSELQAKHALLMQLSQDVQDKYIRMSEDIERLKAHYGSIFRDLDNDLSKRIRELDRKPFTIAEKTRENVILEPFRSEAASAASNVSSGSSGGRITVARIKQKVAEVLNVMSSSVHSNYSYRSELNDTLWEEKLEDEEMIYVPIAYFISDDISSERKNEAFFTPPIPANDNMCSAVRSHMNLRGYGQGKKVSEEDMNMIDHAFSAMVEDMYSNQENDNYNSRVYSEIVRMWNENKNQIKQI